MQLFMNVHEIRCSFVSMECVWLFTRLCSHLHERVHEMFIQIHVKKWRSQRVLDMSMKISDHVHENNQ